MRRLFRNSRLNSVKKLGVVLCTGLIVFWWFFSLPKDLFEDPTSTVVFSKTEELLGATIANDGQWRFPLNKNVHHKFSKSLIAFEDSRFYYHPGIDVFSIGRAMVQNLKENKIVSGASTISMQVIRLHRVNKPRVWKEKIIEMILALRLECRYSKKEIIALWSAHAPFGGNVVGLDAAAWRYYGRDPALLSWGEAATLAVLPNAPTIIHPGKNRQALIRKRNRLLSKLVADGILGETTAELAALEPLPERPKPMPQIAAHLLNKFKQNGFAGKRTTSTIDFELQSQINTIVARHHEQLSQNEIHNAAVLVLDVSSNEIIAYIGNTKAGTMHGCDVDIVRAPRSSGSILKPFLYASMNQEGSLLPTQFVPDIPTQVSGYRPKNFYDRYDGVVPADEALSRSLNIPAVRMLQQYGIEKFHGQLQKMGFSTINRSPHHYGLSLILGGGEVTLWDLTQAYGTMAQSLNRYHELEDSQKTPKWHAMELVPERTRQKQYGRNVALDAGAAFLTFEALTSVKRPASEFGWNNFSTSRRVAWKTGTSIGFRDAWAVGVTPEYVVAVWVGNADGEGRPDLVGVRAAAPLLFDVFRELPSTSWFESPYDALREVEICSKSGYRANKYCPDVVRSFIHKNGRKSLLCDYHKQVYTDISGEYLVNASCFERREMKERTEFVLPPVQAYYYRQQHTDFTEPLPLHNACRYSNDHERMDIIYPQQKARIKVPIDISGEGGQTLFEVAHTDPRSTVFWHIDGDFIGRTESSHMLAMNPSPGRHHLKVVDASGNELIRWFEVVD